ncbi:hypothetical protein [Streptomyces lydicus]|nr:hypothetical protein [Streptomyces lydicus]
MSDTNDAAPSLSSGGRRRGGDQSGALGPVRVAARRAQPVGICL